MKGENMIHLDEEKNICEFSGTAMKLISETGAFLGVLKDEYAERGGDERVFVKMLTEVLNYSLNVHIDEYEHELCLSEEDDEIVSAEELEELVNSLLKERGYGRKN